MQNKPCDKNLKIADVPIDIWMDCNDEFDDVYIEKSNSAVVCNELSSCVDVCMGTSCVSKKVVVSGEINDIEKCVNNAEISTVRSDYQSICGLIYLWFILWLSLFGEKLVSDIFEMTGTFIAVMVVLFKSNIQSLYKMYYSVYLLSRTGLKERVTVI